MKVSDQIRTFPAIIILLSICPKQAGKDRKKEGKRERKTKGQRKEGGRKERKEIHVRFPFSRKKQSPCVF